MTGASGDFFNLICPIRRLEKPGVWVRWLVARFAREYASIGEATGWPLLPAPGPAPTSDDDRARANRILYLQRAVRQLQKLT